MDKQQLDDFGKELQECAELIGTVDISKFPIEDQMMLIIAFKQCVNVIKPIYVRNLANGRGV